MLETMKKSESQLMPVLGAEQAGLASLKEILAAPIIIVSGIAILLLSSLPFISSSLGLEIFTGGDVNEVFNSHYFLLFAWSVSLVFVFTGLLYVGHLFIKSENISVPSLGFGLIGYGLIEAYQLLVVLPSVGDREALIEMWSISRLFLVAGFFSTVMMVLFSLRARYFVDHVKLGIITSLISGFVLLACSFALFYWVSEAEATVNHWLLLNPNGLMLLLAIGTPCLFFLCKKKPSILSIGFLMMTVPMWAFELYIKSGNLTLPTILYLKILLGLTPMVALLAQYLLSYRSLAETKQELLLNQIKLDDALETLTRSNEGLIYASSHDQLTGVANREFFFEEAERAVARAKRTNQRVGFLYLDLNKFKQVNDSYGHAVGDEVLCEFSKRIKIIMRKEDCLARVGGDEFILMVENVGHLENLVVVTEKIMTLLKRPVATSKGEIDCGVSVGVSAFPETKEVADLIKHADIAMYEAKSKETSKFQLFTEELSAKYLEGLSIQSALPEAFKNGHFSLFYQPVYRGADLVLHGVEGLVRWNDPEKGFISPEYFIPIAERSMFINTLGNWVIEEGFKQLQAWRNVHDLNLKLSLNVSVRQLYSDNLIEVVERCLEKYEISAENIAFEISEGQLIQDLQACQDVIGKLKSLGLNIALDDYGSGYASITHLRNLPIDSLKLDRTLIQDLHINRQNKVLTRTTIELAHSLGLTVVAEGIELEEEFQLLMEYKCDFLQGYLFSKAINADDCTKYLAALGK
jgi:diguanylate cyclase (GGDEF)-like protein